MPAHIDTIPVLDAFKQPGECPLCALRAKTQAEYITYFLGASYMEPDERIRVNEKGFCPAHFDMLYQAGNRLGLALMTHTRLKELRARLEKAKPCASNRTLFGKRTAEKHVFDLCACALC